MAIRLNQKVRKDVQVLLNEYSIHAQTYGDLKDLMERLFSFDFLKSKKSNLFLCEIQSKIELINDYLLFNGNRTKYEESDHEAFVSALKISINAAYKFHEVKATKSGDPVFSKVRGKVIYQLT